jgi:hypothetical protein
LLHLIASLILGLGFDAAFAAEKDYPPELLLREQALICRAPDKINPMASMWSSAGNSIRFHPFFNFSLDPSDKTKGSKWIVYDSGQRRPIAIIEDMNTMCGVAAMEGVSGQRITATMQSGRLLGTGAAEGAKSFPGGSVYRLANILGCGTNAGMLVGRLPEGWSVVAFEQQYLDAKRVKEGEDWPRDAKGAAIMLAHNLAGDEYGPEDLPKYDAPEWVRSEDSAGHLLYTVGEVTRYWYDGDARSSFARVNETSDESESFSQYSKGWIIKNVKNPPVGQWISPAIGSTRNQFEKQRLYSAENPSYKPEYAKREEMMFPPKIGLYGTNSKDDMGGWEDPTGSNIIRNDDPAAAPPLPRKVRDILKRLGEPDK